MRPDPASGALLTLEPFLEAVREGLEGAGWELSGLQKTTSYEFEGRWAGDSSRSAYLFFHKPGLPDWASIEVFLDETSRGLKGNLALVLDGPTLGQMPDPARAFLALTALVREALPKGHRTPLTLRYRLGDPGGELGEADTEIRFKLFFPFKALQAGSPAVSALAEATAGAFLRILADARLRPFLPGEETKPAEG